MINIFDPILNDLHHAAHAVSFKGKNKNIEYSYSVNTNTGHVTITKINWFFPAGGWRTEEEKPISIETIPGAIDYLRNIII